MVNIMTFDLINFKFNNLLQSPLLVISLNTSDFLEHFSHNNGELSAYWMSYIDMVENVVPGLLRCSREGNCSLQLNAIRTLIPWCFAYDKLNYASYLSPYYAKMTNLPEMNPYVHEVFNGLILGADVQQQLLWTDSCRPDH